MNSEFSFQAFDPRYAVSVRRNRVRSGMDRVAMRAIDIMLATVALLFLLPLMLIVAVAVFVSDPGPIFFVQNRIGRHGKIFRCLKFRTMATNAEERLAELLANDPSAREEWMRDHKLRNDPRIVGIGSFLRKSSFDELPQLINVLRGEMSLVGPRPIVHAEAARYGRYFEHYCSVRPGITGLWQISGRNDTTYRRRVAFDVAYSRSQSTFLDLRIIVMTVPSVLMAKGSY
ncbi:sugar transferase [Sphingomonas crocodyli]|nr:sugar transferase [Sphingomonas crocodyli]